MSIRIRTTRQARKARAIATQWIFEATLLRWSTRKYRNSQEQAQAWLDLRDEMKRGNS